MVLCAFQHVGTNGFLPSSASEPMPRIPLPEYDSWENLSTQIPSFYNAAAKPGQLRQAIDALPAFPLEPLHLHPTSTNRSADLDEDLIRDIQWRAYSVLSFMAHGYMWCDGDVGIPPSVLPEKLALPWVAVASALDMPPVLTYACYNLLNWRKLDPEKPIQLGNLQCLNDFCGGEAQSHEEWFRHVHIVIESIAAPMISTLPAVQEALLMQSHNLEIPLHAMHDITEALRSMQSTLERMGEGCDPEVYFNFVRQPMSGWKNNNLLPNGLIYEGVSTTPKQYYGETGAQSPILHALDAILGIGHSDGSWLETYLLDMRRHMPPVHRAFISNLEQGRSLRDAALVAPDLVPAYNEAVTELEKFRAQHKAFAYQYIAKLSNRNGEMGTGGSDFMPALKGYQEATSKHLL